MGCRFFTITGNLAALAIWVGAALAGDLPAPDAEFPVADMPQVELGRLLFYDPAACHGRRAVAGTGRRGPWAGACAGG